MSLKEELNKKGYLILDDVIDSNFLSFLENELTLAFNNKELMNTSNGIYFDGENEDKKPFMIGDLLSASESFLNLLYYKPLLNKVSEIFEENEFEFQIMQALIKHPEIGRKVNWHRDWGNKVIRYLNSNVIRTLICIDGLNDNGALQILEDSHKTPDEEILTIKVKTKDIVEKQSEKIKTIYCKKGSIVVLDGKLIHSSLENKSENIRRNILIEWSASSNILLSGMRWFYQGLKPMSNDSLKLIQNEYIKTNLIKGII
jgi:ectoine hydroxylase-related dioxygenase (phytanoyl-CoA dioxygenase family)